jgi:hypothetical protein
MCCSLKHGYQSKRLAPSIDPPFNSPQILKFVSVKFAQQRKRRIRRDVSWAKEATSEKVCVRLVILACGIQAIL